MLNANEITNLAVRALDSKKGHSIKALRTGDLTTLADYFVICTGSSNTQIKALSEAVEKRWLRLANRSTTWRATAVAPGS